MQLKPLRACCSAQYLYDFSNEVYDGEQVLEKKLGLTLNKHGKINTLKSPLSPCIIAICHHEEDDDGQKVLKKWGFRRIATYGSGAGVMMREQNPNEQAYGIIPPYLSRKEKQKIKNILEDDRLFYKYTR